MDQYIILTDEEIKQLTNGEMIPISYYHGFYEKAYVISEKAYKERLSKGE